jgi:hypothetical protein
MEEFNGNNNDSLADSSLATTQALVAYLRMEADLADEKAKRLRAQAKALSEQFGVTEVMQSRYELDPDQLPPMDENGVPKYKGKRRGRKPKPRKRQANPNRKRRQHTAYTLFMKETYPEIKAQNPHLKSKDVISIVAKQWSDQLSPEEKGEWKARAKATHVVDDDEDDNSTNGGDAGATGEMDATAAADAVYQQTVAEMDEDEEVDEDDEVDDDDDEEEEEEIEDEDEPAMDPPPKRRRGRPKKGLEP